MWLAFVSIRIVSVVTGYMNYSTKSTASDTDVHRGVHLYLHDSFREAAHGIPCFHFALGNCCDNGQLNLSKILVRLESLVSSVPKHSLPHFPGRIFKVDAVSGKIIETEEETYQIGID